MRTTLRNLAADLLLGGMLLGTAACAYPTSKSVQGGESSAIYFESFPANALVRVDGQAAGTVGAYDGGARTLAVPPGTHVVEISQDGTILHTGKVFVGRNSALKISR